MIRGGMVHGAGHTMRGVPGGGTILGIQAGDGDRLIGGTSIGRTVR